MPYYAVARGWNTGIYTSWEHCKPMVFRYSGALYRRFNNKIVAWNYLEQHIPYHVIRKMREKEKLFPRGLYNNYIEIFTDAACLENERRRAIASIGVFFCDNHPENVSKIVHRKTYIGAQIEAVLEAVWIIEKYELDHVIIYTDCQFIVKGLNVWIPGWIKRGWRNIYNQPVTYEKEFKFLAAKRRRWCIEFRHVRGHSGIYGNERADALANDALCQFILG